MGVRHAATPRMYRMSRLSHRGRFRMPFLYPFDGQGAPLFCTHSRVGCREEQENNANSAQLLNQICRAPPDGLIGLDSQLSIDTCAKKSSAVEEKLCNVLARYCFASRAATPYRYRLAVWNRETRGSARMLR
jgi:hypothetical protein